MQTLSITSVRKTGRHLWRGFADANRDSRYVLVLAWSVPLLAISIIQALNRGWFDSLERPVFHFFNNLPHFLTPLFYLITQFGSFGSVILWAAAAWYLVSRRAAIMVVCGGFVGWLLAKVVKVMVHRGRPQDFLHMLHNVHLFHNQLFSGYGFPSGHATFSATSATILYYQVRPRYRKYLLLVVLAVGVSRMYLGAHFPLDVVGGWALGATIGATVTLIAGSEIPRTSVFAVRRVLAKAGYDIHHVGYLNTDARGSRPVFIEMKNGEHLFGKIVGKREHAADWLFKTYRFFRYKNLTAEEPYLNARRNVELESFATMWAQKAGVRVPEIRGLYRLGSSWLLVQQQIAGKPLPAHKRILQRSLEDIWRQVRRMHEGNLAHRDLRAANIMLGSDGKAWIIDFGFAEVAPGRLRRNMDNAELLMSMSLLAGAKRTVQAAGNVLEPETLKEALPYLQKSVFSNATAQDLKRDKQALPELRDALRDTLVIREEVKPVDIDRFNMKKIVGIAAIAVFIYLVIPQFKAFSGDLDYLSGAAYGWALPALLLSALSYIMAAGVYVVLSNVPLQLHEATLIQVASSFVSKVVPGGLGGTTLNARYLNKSGLDAGEASAVITGQNIIGVIMFVLPLGIMLVLAGHSVSSVVHFHIAAFIPFLLLAAVLLSIPVLVLSRKLREKLVSFVQSVLQSLQSLAASPQSIGLAACASFAITLCYIGCLYLCTLAFHVHLSFLEAAITYASAVIFKTAIPTPGGIGPLEIAMAGALVGYGVATGPAYAVVILYRLLTYWLPIPFSLLAYRYADKRSLI